VDLKETRRHDQQRTSMKDIRWLEDEGVKINEDRSQGKPQKLATRISMAGKGQGHRRQMEDERATVNGQTEGEAS